MRMKWLPVAVALALIGAARVAAAQDSWAVGGFFGPGIPAFAAGVGVTAPLGRTVAVDVSLSRIGLGLDNDSALSPAVTTVARWTRGGRGASGNSRYWILGAMAFRERESELFVYPGNVREPIVASHVYVIPRIGYGWDHVTRHGVRVGLDLTAGSAGEAIGLISANVFVMWGPQR